MEKGVQADAEIETVEAFRQDLLQEYTALAAGEWARFWRVARLLQFDPATARGRQQFSDRILSFPAMSVLPLGAPTQLAASAHDFLVNENDHALEWLGSDTYDLRAWAGYLALALLDEADALNSLPIECTTSWTGAILWFWSVPLETADPERKRRLIRRAIDADPVRMEGLLTRYVRGELRRGASASELEAFDAGSVRAIQETWIGVIEELHSALFASELGGGSESDVTEPLGALGSNEVRSAARYALERMFSGLAVADLLAAETLATLWATTCNDANRREIAAAAIAALLSTDAGVWRHLVATVHADDDLGRLVAATIANRQNDVGLVSALDEQELRDLYVWLARIYPTEEDVPEDWGANWVTPAAQARRWRDGVLTAIGNRGTNEAVLVLSSLHERFPSRIIVLSNLVRARVAAFASAWEPPSPAEVQSLLEDARRRLVRSGTELAALIQEALLTLEADLVRT